MPQGLPYKLRRRFLVQALVASVVLVVAIAVGCSLTLSSLIDARLQGQVEEFWAARAANPGYVPPRTAGVQVYFVPAGSAIETVPPALRRAPGSHALPGFDRHLRVESRPEGTVYVQMSFAYAKRLMWAASMLFALLGSLGLFGLSWLTYRATSRLVMPVTWLARRVSSWDMQSSDMDALDVRRSPGHVGSEVRQLSSALGDLATRVRAMMQRERDFTRDASHELRTPLTVVRVASDMLLAEPEPPARARRSLQRIQAAGRDMEAVVEAFLILARDTEVEPQDENFRVREVVDEEVERVLPLLAGKPVELRVTGAGDPMLSAPPRVLGVMLANLLSNACVFTERGQIEVEVTEAAITVRDTGIGMSPGTLQRVYDPFFRVDQFHGPGKGMGLSIVRRLGDRFGWPVSLRSAQGQGTEAEIRFAK